MIYDEITAQTQSENLLTSKNKGLQLELYRTSTLGIECAEAVTYIKWGTQRTSMICGYLVSLMIYPIIVC